MTQNNDQSDQAAERAKLLNAARQAATTALIEAHREEFNSLMESEANKRGVPWKRKLTKDERAAKELELLVAANPELARVLASKYGTPAVSTASGS